MNTLETRSLFAYSPQIIRYESKKTFSIGYSLRIKRIAMQRHFQAFIFSMIGETN